MVDLLSGEKVFLVKQQRRMDLPTLESPISTTLLVPAQLPRRPSLLPRHPPRHPRPASHPLGPFLELLQAASSDPPQAASPPVAVSVPLKRRRLAGVHLLTGAMGYWIGGETKDAAAGT